MQFGINLDGWNADHNLLCGNYVGVDVTGTIAQGNGADFNLVIGNLIGTDAIEYYLPVAGRMTMRVLDIRGRVVRSLVASVQPAEIGSVQWNGVDEEGKTVPSGLYFAEFRFANEVQVSKMTVTK